MKFTLVHSAAALALGVAALALVAGCNSDSTLTPPPAGSLDVSAVISQMSAGSLTGIPGATAILPIPASVTPPPVVPSVCTYSSTSRAFVCPSVASNGVTFDATYWLYDASGTSMSQADAATTAAVRAVVDARGTVTGSVATVAGSMTVANHSDLTLGGLLATNRVLNGTTAGHDSITRTSGTPAYAVVDVTTTAANVVVPPGTGDGTTWPLSGTLAVDARTVTWIGSLSPLVVSGHIVVTFNGTKFVTVAGTVATVPVTCRVDLTGSVAPVCT